MDVAAAMAIRNNEDVRSEVSRSAVGFSTADNENGESRRDRSHEAMKHHVDDHICEARDCKNPRRLNTPRNLGKHL